MIIIIVVIVVVTVVAVRHMLLLHVASCRCRQALRKQAQQHGKQPALTRLIAIVLAGSVNRICRPSLEG